MATDKTRPVRVRLPVETIATFQKYGELRPFLEKIAHSIDIGEIVYEDGLFHGPPPPLEEDLDLSDLKAFQKMMGAKKLQQALDTLTSRALGGY